METTPKTIGTKKITTKHAYARAVKNRLCRIEDNIQKVYVANKKMSEDDKRKLMTATIEIDEFYEKLKDIEIVCGKLQEFPDKLFIGGCGKPINIMKVYACVDCSAPFHRKCLLKHIKEDMPVDSLSKMSLKEAFKKIDELANNQYDK